MLRLTFFYYSSQSLNRKEVYIMFKLQEIPGQLSLSMLPLLQLQWIRFLRVLLLRPVKEQTCLQPTGPAAELQIAMEVLLEQEAAFPMWHLRSTSTYNISCH